MEAQESGEVILVSNAAERRTNLVAGGVMVSGGLALVSLSPWGPVGLAIGSLVILVFGYWTVTSVLELFKPRARLVLDHNGFRTQHQSLVLWSDVEAIEAGEFRHLTYVLPQFVYVSVSIRDLEMWRRTRNRRERFDLWLWKVLRHVDLGVPVAGLGMPASELVTKMKQRWNARL